MFKEAGSKIEFSCMLLAICLLTHVLHGMAWSKVAKKTPVSLDSLEKAMSLSAAYLVKQVRDDGSFLYRVNMDPDVFLSEKYNFLRHAGTIYSMAQYLQVAPNKDLRLAIERSGRYFQKATLGPVPGNSDDLLAVWSYPKINNTDAPVQAKLGGVGLGLVALLSIEKISPGFTSIETLRKLGKFILFLQKRDGGFYSKYIPSKGGLQKHWESLYYPGEAALGLIMLYEQDGDDAWIRGAGSALGYLAKKRRSEREIPADHWALLATERLLSYGENVQLPVSRDLLIQHALQICESILSEQFDNVESVNKYGGFADDGRTTPTATRLEGLLATLFFLPEQYKDARNRIETAVKQGISFLLRAQVKEGPFSGGIPRGVEKMSDNISQATKFNRRVQEIRIDYVQHALSAMIWFYKLGR